MFARSNAANNIPPEDGCATAAPINDQFERARIERQVSALPRSAVMVGPTERSGCNPPSIKNEVGPPHGGIAPSNQRLFGIDIWMRAYGHIVDLAPKVIGQSLFTANHILANRSDMRQLNPDLGQYESWSSQTIGVRCGNDEPHKALARSGLRGHDQPLVVSMVILDPHLLGRRKGFRATYPLGMAKFSTA